MHGSMTVKVNDLSAGNRTPGPTVRSLFSVRTTIYRFHNVCSKPWSMFRNKFTLKLANQLYSLFQTSVFFNEVQKQEKIIIEFGIR